MSIEGAPEPALPIGSAIEPPARAQAHLDARCGLPGGGGLLGFSVWRIYQNQHGSGKTASEQEAELLSRPVPVQMAAAERKPMPIYLTALGTVTPYMSVTVKARVSGELEPVRFTEGQQVRQGQTIMVIDPRPYKAALDQAKGTLAHDEALLKDAQAEYKRYKRSTTPAWSRRRPWKPTRLPRASTRVPSSPTRQPLKPHSCSSTGAPSSRPSTAASVCAWWTPATSSLPTPPTWSSSISSGPSPCT